MYDKNEIEDSLEFCRQIKEYAKNSGVEIEEVSEDTTENMLANLAAELEHEDRPWEKILDEMDPAGADLSVVKPFEAPPELSAGTSASVNTGAALQGSKEANFVKPSQDGESLQQVFSIAEEARKAGEAAKEQERKRADNAKKLEMQRAETRELEEKSRQRAEADAERIAKAQREAVARARAQIAEQKRLKQEQEQLQREAEAKRVAEEQERARKEAEARRIAEEQERA
ncbi:MAG: hypothetical protein J1E62_10480, partial [Lachnospiraceae bacterium]|nr:hypothetical protein [Lachnospiraceae bacterium]